MLGANTSTTSLIFSKQNLTKWSVNRYVDRMLRRGGAYAARVSDREKEEGAHSASTQAVDDGTAFIFSEYCMRRERAAMWQTRHNLTANMQPEFLDGTQRPDGQRRQRDLFCNDPRTNQGDFVESKWAFHQLGLYPWHTATTFKSKDAHPNGVCVHEHTTAENRLLDNTPFQLKRRSVECSASMINSSQLFRTKTFTFKIFINRSNSFINVSQRHGHSPRECRPHPLRLHTSQIGSWKTPILPETPVVTNLWSRACKYVAHLSKLSFHQLSRHMRREKHLT